MKLVQINITCGQGSTGKICVAVSELLSERGVENYILYSSGKSDYPSSTKYMDQMEIKIQALWSRIKGNYGFNSKRATRKLISILKNMQPDVIQLHNLHGHNCDLEMLFAYLKKEKIRIFWTFHDCWAFTGYCPHYDMIGCDQWKSSCEKCPQRKRFSWFYDKSKTLYQKKKDLFADLNMTIVVPSDWMRKQVEQSFLYKYDVAVINNGIDLSVFNPQESDFRKKYRCEEKFVVLGVQFDWGIRKGLDVFIELGKRLDHRFQIVLVGTNDQIDKMLPSNIISIHRTQNQTELAQIYTAADLFVNATREENYPTVNMEAIACGTPVLTFDTGGSREMLDETCGAVVDKNDIEALIDEIVRIYDCKPFNRTDCIKRAKTFDANKKYEEYIKLYEEKNSVSY